MYKNERITEILQILQNTRYTTVEHLASELHISASSIRRDLATLEERGMVMRSYGGVELVISDNLNIPFAMRLQENSREKKKIAVKAAALVNDGDVVFIDGSTSGYYLIRELTEKKGITIITNSVNGLYYLSAFQIKTISTGGTVNHENRAVLVGDEVIRMLSDLRANIAFFSSQALDANGTLFDCYQAEIPVINRMLASASCKVFLCDSNKIGKISTFKQCTLADLDVIVCDQPLQEQYGEAFPNLRFV